MPDGTYSLADLCDLADVTPRTVRYYISQGLLRSPGTTGPGARYDDGHLARLRLIRRLQREHLPLAEIRKRLAALTDDEAISQAGGPAGPPAESALDYVRSVLDAGALGRPARTPQVGPGVAPAVTPVPPGAPLPAGTPRIPPLLLRQELALPSDEVRYADSVAQPLLRRVEGAPAGAAAAPPASAPSPSAAPAGAPPAAAPSAPPERSSWERITLAPDVELHVRRPLTRSQNRAVARLVETARQLLEEDQP